MVQSAPPEDAIAFVSIGKSFRLAHALVFGNLGPLLRAAALPFVLSWVIFYLLVLPTGGQPLLAVIATLVALVPYVLFAVSWHRFVLLGRNEALPAIVPLWRRRHWRFYGYLLGLMGIILLASLPIGLLLAVLAAPTTGGDTAPQPSQALIATVLLFVIPLFYLVMRLSFVFPAVSVDESYRFVHAWRHSRGQGWRLVGATIVTLFPTGLLSGVTTLAVSFAYFGDTRLISGEGLVDESGSLAAGAQSAMLVDAVVTQPLGYIMTALFVTVLSFAFRVSTGWIPPNEGAMGSALEPADRE